jgi:hypothetical protein
LVVFCVYISGKANKQKIKEVIENGDARGREVG